MQNAAKACGKGAARDLEGGYCLTLLSEATRKVLGKRPEACKMQQKPLAKGAARDLEENAAKASAKGAARDLEGGYCLTLPAEATRKVLGKRPEACKMQQKPLAKGAARLKPVENSWKVPRSLQNAAKASAKGAARKCSKSLWAAGGQRRACKMQQKPLLRALRGIWREATA